MKPAETPAALRQQAETRRAAAAILRAQGVELARAAALEAEAARLEQQADEAGQ